MTRFRIRHNLATAGRQRRDTGPVTQPGDDFEEFVAARWPELHAVATITTADAVHATSATATALATVQGRWAELTSSGAPTRAARTAVLTAALRAARSTTPPSLPGATVRAAVTAALAGAPATARAALAVDHFWGEDDTMVAACARRDPATVHRDHAALLTLLAAAHSASLGRDQAELAWALPAAIADTLTHLADSAPTANPLTEVRAARARATRGRALRAAAAVAFSMAAAGAVVLVWTAPETVPTLPADSPAWAVVTSWTPRGPLAGDSDVAALAATATAGDPGAHLLYAGPVGDTTVVLMTATSDPAVVPDGGLGEGSDPTRNVELKMWTAPAGADPATLTATTIAGSDSHAVPVAADTVAVSIPQRAPAGGHVVLVMTPPAVTEGSATTGACPQPDGTFRPLVQALTLRGGVATLSVAPGFPALLEVNRYNGLRRRVRPRHLDQRHGGRHVRDVRPGDRRIGQGPSAGAGRRDHHRHPRRRLGANLPLGHHRREQERRGHGGAGRAPSRRPHLRPSPGQPHRRQVRRPGRSGRHSPAGHHRRQGARHRPRQGRHGLTGHDPGPGDYYIQAAAASP